MIVRTCCLILLPVAEVFYCIHGCPRLQMLTNHQSIFNRCQTCFIGHMPTSQWIKKLAGHAGELYVAAELSKRGIPNSLLPENFSDDDIMLGVKDGGSLGWVQVKSCHPDRGNTFRLIQDNENWINSEDNSFVVFVWLGSPKKNESPQYWIAKKKDVGDLLRRTFPKDSKNRERRFAPDLASGLPTWKYDRLEEKWRNNWNLFDDYRPDSQ